MGAPTQHYVDPSIAGNSGAGTLGNPYGDLQHAYDQGRDPVNGDLFSVMNTAPELPVAILSLAAYGIPTIDAPLITRGCDDSGNYGVGEIDGGAGGFRVMDTQAEGKDYVHFINMKLHNTGTRALWLRHSSSVINCEIGNSPTWGVLALGNYCKILGNYLHGPNAGAVIYAAGYNTIFGNYVESVAGQCIFLAGTSNYVARNILVPTVIGVGGTVISAANQAIVGNTIFSPVVNTGAGVLFDAGVHRDCILLDNLIEGFSGVGGGGLDLGGAGQNLVALLNNSFFGNAGNDIINPSDINLDEDNDLDMASSPFAKHGAMTFANRFRYFAPRHVGAVRGGAYPNGCRIERGAVQHGSTLVHPGTSGGARG